MKQHIRQRIDMTKEKLKSSIDYLIYDHLTDCYNQLFLHEYLMNEIDLIDYQKEAHQNLLLAFIKIDNIMDINIKYSNEIGDETISNLSYLLKELTTDNEILFKRPGPNFVILCPNFKGNITEFIGNIQNKTRKSEVFIEPITISAAIVSLEEINRDLSTLEKVDLLLNKGADRIYLSQQFGNNAYIDKDTTIETNFFGNILIVDSDLLTLSIMKNYFEENHFNVTTTQNGLEALNIAKEHKFDVIIADRFIKKIDGITLKKHLNESSMNMNTLYLLTVQSKNTDIIDKANLISVDHIYDKPIILQELLGVIIRETKKRECMLK